MELPPRARRIPPHPHIHATSLGTTSACAENTRKPHRLEFPAWNYLRVRGEYNWPVSSVGLSVELPPRARRIRKTNTTNKDYAGTTSACAENTYLYCSAPAPKGNYLRVRGEYRSLTLPARNGMELPPRARRILRNLHLPINDDGTTSACAENTKTSMVPKQYQGNYLRVRGEYLAQAWFKNVTQELPPRARRILAKNVAHNHGVGTTSACAENTPHH